MPFFHLFQKAYTQYTQPHYARLLVVRTLSLHVGVFLNVKPSHRAVPGEKALLTLTHSSVTPPESTATLSKILLVLFTSLCKSTNTAPHQGQEAYESTFAGCHFMPLSRQLHMFKFLMHLTLAPRHLTIKKIKPK